MDDRIPLVIYGDGPRLPSGLARIARDLALRLEAESDALGIRLVQVGVDYPQGWHWRPWELYGFQPNEKDQGRLAMAQVVAELTAEHTRRPIVLMIMDPSRCYDLTRADKLGQIEAEWWGYFPVDAENAQGRIGGPAARAVADCQRVLAYGRYGARVLWQTLQGGYPGPDGGSVVPLETPPPVAWLPHGIDTRVFRPAIGLEQADDGFRDWAQAVPPQALRIGCVATNQPRKDLGLLFSAAATIKAQGHPVRIWLQTDRVIGAAWAISELCASLGFAPEEVAVTPSMDLELTDTQLAARYGWSDVTLAPGLGEGYGYPIVESLACGTPVVHGAYAGGVELIPRPDWRVEPAAWRLESGYAVQRPVFRPSEVATALVTAAQEKRRAPRETMACCSGAVAYLDWQHVWPRWRQWLQDGWQAPT